MSFTSTSSRPCSASMRATRPATCSGSRWSTRTRDRPRRRPRCTSSAVSSIVSGRSTSERRLAACCGRCSRRSRRPRRARRRSPRPAPRVAPGDQRHPPGQRRLPCAPSGSAVRGEPAAPAGRRSARQRRSARARRPAAARCRASRRSTTNASSTVTSGSAVERIDAVVGPTRRSPAKNSPIAATVETTAIAASQPSPGAVTASGCRSPTTQRPRPSASPRRRCRRCAQHDRPGAARRSPRS